MIVDQKHHKHFVARRCEVLKQLEDEFPGVAISFPRNGVSSDRVTVKGPPQHIETVKQKITDIIKDLVSIGKTNLYILFSLFHNPSINVLFLYKQYYLKQ